MNMQKLPIPDRTPGDESNWTEWDVCREWFTVAVTENDNVALIDNTDPDAAVFLAPGEAKELARALMAAAHDANARIERALAEEGK
mgnify:CR=1 FL=1